MKKSEHERTETEREHLAKHADIVKRIRKNKERRQISAQRTQEVSMEFIFKDSAMRAVKFIYFFKQNNCFVQTEQTECKKKLNDHINIQWHLYYFEDFEIFFLQVLF